MVFKFLHLSLHHKVNNKIKINKKNGRKNEKNEADH